MARWRALFLDAALRGRPPAGLQRRHRGQSVRDLRGAAGRRALPLHARRGRVHDHGLHQGPGVPRPDGAQRDRGPLLGHLPRARPTTTTRPWPRCSRATPTCCACPPAAATPTSLIPWLHYARLENEYLKAKSAFARRSRCAGRRRLDLRLIWDGDGRNDNAALTVFRHFDSATVVKGLVGEAPKTAWVIGYPLLERIHYLLVADYDVYGNVGHQLNSRLYMDFLRMEGEFNFLTLAAPGAARRDARPVVPRRQPGARASRSTAARRRRWTSRAPSATGRRPEARTAGTAEGAPGAGAEHPLRPRIAHAPPALRAPLQELAARARRGAAMAAREPRCWWSRRPDGTRRPFSLLRNTGARQRVAPAAARRRELRPDENTLTVVPGVLGSYPNAFYRARGRRAAGAGRGACGGCAREADYAAFAQRWAVRRTNPDFWAFSDALHDALSHATSRSRPACSTTTGSRIASGPSAHSRARSGPPAGPNQAFAYARCAAASPLRSPLRL